MPQQTGKMTLAGKLGQSAKQAHEAHKGDETTFGMINLPAGIVGGVAQLRTVKVDVYKAGAQYAGKPYVMFRGIAVRPERLGDVKVAGQGVLQMIPMCDTPTKKVNKQPKMFADNWAELLNEIRKLGIDTADTEIEDIDGILATLEQEQPFYNFSTRAWTPPAIPGKPAPTPMTIVQFDGKCDPEGAPVVDPAAGFHDGGGGDGEVAAPAEDGGEELDLDALAALCDGDDDQAQSARDKLAELAKAANIEEGDAETPGTIQGASSWSEVVEMIRAAAGSAESVAGAEGEAPEPETPPTPEPAKAAPKKTTPAPKASADPKKGDVREYLIFDAATKKKKAIKVEVLAVDAAKKTATVKRAVEGTTVNGANKKPLGIPFGELTVPK